MEAIYHVFNKSIAGFKIFNNNHEFLRILDTLTYYQREKPRIKFSEFIKLVDVRNDHAAKGRLLSEREKLVEIVAYCLMPTHLHLLLKQIKEEGISIFMNKTLNSYTRYFNIKYNRKGPLWESRSKKVLVKTDEQLLHLTRYIHLNPVTAYLIDKPEEWTWSSYKAYLSKDGYDGICQYDDILVIEPSSYKEFVDDRISYQRELGLIKALLFE